MLNGVGGLGQILRKHPSAQNDTSSQTFLSRAGYKLPVTMKPVSLVRKMARKVQRLKKKRKSSRFSLMESRQSTSSLKGYFAVKKKLSTSTPFRLAEEEFEMEHSVSPVQILQKKSRPDVKEVTAKQKKGDKKASEKFPLQLPAISFRRSFSPNSSESSFGTKISTLLEEHERQIKDLKSRQKQQLQMLLENLSGVAQRQETARRHPSPPPLALPQSPPPIDDFDSDRNFLMESQEEALPDRELTTGVEPKTPAPPSPLPASNARRTTRSTGRGRKWHGYESDQKGWWVV